MGEVTLTGQMEKFLKGEISLEELSDRVGLATEEEFRAAHLAGIAVIAKALDTNDDN